MFGHGWLHNMVTFASFAAHALVGSLATYELFRLRSNTEQYVVILAVSAAIAAMHLLGLGLYVLKRHTLPYESARKHLRQLLANVTYVLVAAVLNEAEGNTALVSSQDAWFIVSTPLKLMLVWFGFSNVIDMLINFGYKTKDEM